MAWPSEAGAIAASQGVRKRRGRAKPDSQVYLALRDQFIPPPWTTRSTPIKRGVIPRRRHQRGVGSHSIRKINKIRFRNRFVDTYRVATTAEYRFYRSNVGPPLESDSPFATNATLPFTPTSTFADGTWYVSVNYFSGILLSGFLPLGPNGETYLRLDISGGTVLLAPPDGPIVWELEQRAGGVIRIKAYYRQDGSLRATEWAITYTTDGSTPGTPPAVSPTVTVAMPSSGLAVLEYDLPAQANGTTVKVRLQTRRNDGTWRYSENSVVLTMLADSLGPTAALSIQSWRGKLPDGV